MTKIRDRESPDYPSVITIVSQKRFYCPTSIHEHHHILNRGTLPSVCPPSLSLCCL
jgi:hypothetical protein